MGQKNGRAPGVQRKYRVQEMEEPRERAQAGMPVPRKTPLPQQDGFDVRRYLDRLALGIAGRKCQTVIWRHFRRRILRAEEKGVENSRSGPRKLGPHVLHTRAPEGIGLFWNG